MSRLVSNRLLSQYVYIVLSQFKDTATLLSKNLKITALTTLISMITTHFVCLLSLSKTLLHRLHYCFSNVIDTPHHMAREYLELSHLIIIR